MFIQNLDVAPKYRARRSAVSAVMPRFSLTMSLMRVAGTRSAIANWCADMPRGDRNSSRRISPGSMSGSRSLSKVYDLRWLRARGSSSLPAHDRGVCFRRIRRLGLLGSEETLLLLGELEEPPRRFTVRLGHNTILQAA